MHVPAVIFGQVEAVWLESVIGKWLNSTPKIPERQVIFRSEQRHITIDAFIAFAVIRFGGKDRDHARVDQLADDLAQIIGIARLEVCANLDDDKGWTIDS